MRHPNRFFDRSRLTHIQLVMTSVLTLCAGCDDVKGGKSISGAEGHAKPDIQGGTSAAHAGGMGGRDGQAGKAATASAGSAGRSTANSASRAAGTNAVTAPDEKVLASGCEFVASDWLTDNGEQQAVF